jgi:hypothetical protein
LLSQQVAICLLQTGPWQLRINGQPYSEHSIGASPDIDRIGDRSARPAEKTPDQEVILFGLAFANCTAFRQSHLANSVSFARLES